MKKIMFSTLTILLVIGLMGAGTVAWFQDTETSTGNTFQAGTLDLKIMDQNQPYTDGVVATWTANNMAPGDNWVFKEPFAFVRLDAHGSIHADHLEISCDFAVIEENPQTEADTDPLTNLNPDSMAKSMVITRLIYRDGNWSINALTDPNTSRRIDDQDGDGRITFYDFKRDPLDNLTPPNAATTVISEMGVRFDPIVTTSNNFQGDTFNLTMKFTLNQHSSQ